MKKGKVRFALEALNDVSKKFGIKRMRSVVYNLNTLREQKASIFVLTLEAPIINSEWDNLSEKALIKLLRLRFEAHLSEIFNERE